MWVKLLMINFGVGMDKRKTSNRDKFFRKKYMGVWSFRSRVMRVMMRKLLIMTARYITRKNSPHTVCSSGTSENPIKKNPVILVLLRMIESSTACQVWEVSKNLQTDIQKCSVEMDPGHDLDTKTLLHPPFYLSISCHFY